MMQNRFRRMKQAYRELPWRKRVRYLLWGLAAVLAVASIFAFEVHLSAQALVLDYQLRALQQSSLEEEQDIVVLRTRLAALQSMETLLQVAQEQGYAPVDPAQEHYVPVPANALPPREVPVPREVATALQAEPPLPKAYTISLIGWLSHYLLLEPMQ